MKTTSRRPLKSRGTRWAAKIAQGLALARIRPNTISMFSVVFAALAGLAYFLAGTVAEPWQWFLCFLGAALCIQLRLLCNLFDGMVAVEGGLGTKSGEIYNELPDRFADVMILAGAGYAVPENEFMPLLGWLCAVGAVTAAYVRALGASAGATQCFMGPMAKPQRMAVMTAASVLASAAPLWSAFAFAVPAALALIAAGCLITIFRRTRRIIRELEAS